MPNLERTTIEPLPLPRGEPVGNIAVRGVVSGSLDVEQKSPTEPATSWRREKRTAPLGLRIAPSLKAAVEKAARADRLSVTRFVEKVLIERLRNDGFSEEEVKNPHPPLGGLGLKAKGK